ncbi:MAG TPA: putative O-glycosylation ligase, exosortase A system-associated [Rhizomicrobium sp.]
MIGILAALCITLPFPFAGVLVWTWFSLQNPHQEAYGFVQSLPINFGIALVTVSALLLSQERKRPRNDIIFLIIAAFLAWVTFNGFFAFDRTWSWPYWDITWKSFVLGLIISITANSRVRIHALLWVIVASLFYFGIKGGLFTLATAGRFHVQGPADTIIADNNQLAVALLMSLPLAYFLRAQSLNKWISRGLLAGMVLTIIAILGSYSRGAFIGLAALGIFALLRTRRRLLYLGFATTLVIFGFAFMPEMYDLRIQTIGSASQDASFQGRLVAWKVAWDYAVDHFPFGAGFYGPQLPTLFHAYFPDETAHAAHSIYFQVLGEQGFIGLALYLILLALAFLRCSSLASRARAIPDQLWIADLAVAIQASLLVFCVAAAALSMAYYDLFVICVALLLPLTEMVGRPAAIEPRPAMPVVGGGRESAARSSQGNAVR